MKSADGSELSFLPVSMELRVRLQLLVAVSTVPSRREAFSLLPVGKQQLFPQHPAASNLRPTDLAVPQSSVMATQMDTLGLGSPRGSRSTDGRLVLHHRASFLPGFAGQQPHQAICGEKNPLMTQTNLKFFTFFGGIFGCSLGFFFKMSYIKPCLTFSAPLPVLLSAVC